jgi:integrase
MEVEPIRDSNKILSIRKILKVGRNGLSDDLLFVLGINTAFRISDLLSLTLGDVLDNGRIVSEICLKEQKTGKQRRSPLNSVALAALREYLASRGPLGELSSSDPLFPSQKGRNSPLLRQQAYRILSSAGRVVGLSRIGAHSLRKTFGYHAFKQTGGNLALIQRLLNHSSPGVTLRYRGITQDDLNNDFMNIKLG